MKQNKNAKICFVIHIAGEKKLLFYIYAVIVKQNFINSPVTTTHTHTHTHTYTHTHTHTGDAERDGPAVAQTAPPARGGGNCKRRICSI